MSEGARHTNSRPQGSRVDPYLEHYAVRARGMVASEIRALFAVAARPEVVSLAGGMPYISALPLDVVGEMAGQLVADRGAVALQYGSGQGDPGLREGICEVMSLEGIRAHPDEVVVTVGSQQALDLITRIFVDPGDVVLAEGPAYVGALGTFASYEANVVHVPMDEHGLVPAALDAVLSRLAAAGRRVSSVHLPVLPQPGRGDAGWAAPRRDPRISASARVCRWSKTTRTGCSASTASRPWRCAPMTRQVDLPGARSPRRLRPGCGWAGRWRRPGARQTGTGRGVRRAVPFQLRPAAGPRVPGHPAVAGAGQGVPRAVPRAAGRDAGFAAGQHAGGLPVDLAGRRVLRVAGAAGLWDAKAMLPRAIAARVAYVPGTGFYADGTGADHLRLSYCFPKPDRIREGVHRLAGVIDAELALRSTFGPPQ